MSQIVSLKKTELIPTPNSVLQQMGVPKNANTQQGVLTFIEEAIEIFSECAQPVGLVSEIAENEFAMIYKGEGENAKDTPLEHIFTKADY